MILLGLSVIRGLLYCAITPPWQAPDEPQHFQYVRFIVETGRLPTGEDAGDNTPWGRQVYASMLRFDFWELRQHSVAPEGPLAPASRRYLKASVFHPPLYFLFCSPFLLPFASSDLTAQVYVLRLVSTALGTLTVGVAYLTARALFPDDASLSWTIPAFVLFLPMHTSITSSINNDNLAELLASLTIYLSIRACKHGLSPTRALGMGLSLAMSLLTKRTTAFLLPLAILTALVCPWQKAITIDRGRVIRRVALLSTLCLMGIGLWLLSYVAGYYYENRVLKETALKGTQIASKSEDTLPYQTYLPVVMRGHPKSETPLPLRLLSALHGFPSQLLRIRSRSLANLLDGQKYTPAALRSYALFVLLTFASFWANFGWMNIPLDPIGYGVLAGVSLLALGGLSLFFFRQRRGDHLLKPWQRRALLLLSLSVVFILFQTLGLMISQGTPQQGRYLFPAVIPIATLFVLGWRELIPVRSRRALLLLCSGGLFVLDSISIVYYIIPHFYG